MINNVWIKFSFKLLDVKFPNFYIRFLADFIYGFLTCVSNIYTSLPHLDILYGFWTQALFVPKKKPSILKLLTAQKVKKTQNEQLTDFFNVEPKFAHTNYTSVLR